MVVFCLGMDLLFKSVLGHCDFFVLEWKKNLKNLILFFINLDKHENDGQRLDEWVSETHEKKTPIKLSLLLFDWVFFSAESMSRLYLYVAAR